MGKSHSRIRPPSRRGEGGEEWPGGPLWSPTLTLNDAGPQGLIVVAITYIVGYTTVAVKIQQLEVWSYLIQLKY